MLNTQLKLLGRPAVVFDGVPLPMPEKGYVLFAILAAANGRAVDRARLKVILWGNSDQAKATANLRQLIARIQRIAESAGAALLDIRGNMLGLAPSTDSDYGRVLGILASDLAGESVALDGEALLGLWAGPLLDGLSFDGSNVDDWLDARRDQLRQDFIEAARRRLDRESDGEADVAWRLALKVIEIDDTEESAYRAMMRICAARGDRGLALRVFGRCRRTLATELGVEPSQETADLAAVLRHREPQPPAYPSAQARAETTGLADSRADGEARTSAVVLRQVPTVMVLPPISVMLEPALRDLALGFIEDVTIGLTRFRRFAVIAPHSSASVALVSGSLEEALAVLDVDYVVTTALLPGSRGPRIAVRLADSSNGEVLWATESEFVLSNLGAAFDRIVSQVVRSVVSSIDDAVIRAPIPADAFTAYRRYLEGRRQLHRIDLQAIRRARRFFKEAIAEAPGYAPAMIGLARSMSIEWLVRGLTENQLLKDSVLLAGDAAARDPLDGRAKREQGAASLYLRRFDESLHFFEEGLRLNPHDADIMADYADALAHAGEPRRALLLCRRALELNPIPPDDYVWTLASIHYQLGDYGAAIETARQVEDNPAMARLLAAAAAQLGEIDLARRYARVVRSVYPGFSADSVRDIIPNRDPVDTEHVVDGLRRAGLG